VKTWLILACLSLAACASTSLQQQGAGSCNAAGLDDLAGTAATQELGAAALRRSGASILRWMTPGMIVTMEYRGDRLNIHVDEQGRVSRVGCG
jgi:hypothetical protein